MEIVQKRQRMQSEIEKSQLVRLIDVFFIGPFLIYVAMKADLGKVTKFVLLIIGIATIIYNGSNYIQNMKQ